jgi:hypothetical protein
MSTHLIWTPSPQATPTSTPQAYTSHLWSQSSTHQTRQCDKINFERGEKCIQQVIGTFLLRPSSGFDNAHSPEFDCIKPSQIHQRDHVKHQAFPCKQHGPCCAQWCVLFEQVKSPKSLRGPFFMSLDIANPTDNCTVLNIVQLI